ncbi:MAG: nitroreductase family deazaflavin-dependent oxidoreductase [Gemmatimonadaceae bacterium]|nr:nitroreductase family deazaflavin-dependent oxidoreductase [Gemmatimonadaceae bacterium]
MAENFLYLTTTGRTSGEPRRIEIWYVERAGCHYMISERREESNWVKNIQHDPEVIFSVGTRADPTAALPPTRATGRVVSERDEPELASAVRSLMDAKYGWSAGLIIELSPRG